ncbi:hypothetical protein GQ42DRAFT_157787 [Ramicandelaber brevisporus]|nr:hypothetical protein GQ42DRAFT_157787 [Ramicandelaber brevisporus]
MKNDNNSNNIWPQLLALPTELLEYLTLYFDSHEGYLLLTVSSSFHILFARSVWRVITRKTAAMPEPTRSAAYARYGRLVRKVDLYVQLHEPIELPNWLALFPNTVKFGFDIREWMGSDQKQLIFDAISGLHGLRAVEVFIWTNRPPFDLDAIAKLLIARDKDHTKQSVRQLEIIFGDSTRSDSWIVLNRFVSEMDLLKLAKLRIRVRTEGNDPTPAQFAALRPYLAEIPYGRFIDEMNECHAMRNRNLFKDDYGSNGEMVVFPQMTFFRAECLLCITRFI